MRGASIKIDVTHAQLPAPARSALPAQRGAFHLLALEYRASGGPAQAEGRAHVVLVIPAAGARIAGDAEQGARLADESQLASVTLEPLARHGSELLLAVRAAGVELELNGLPAPRVTLLRPGDEIRLAGGAPLFVDFFRQPPFALADAEQAGARCQLCRGPLEQGRRIHVCACGALSHADVAGGSSSAAQAESLDCAFGTCTACNRPIASTAGYVKGGADGQR